MAVPVVDITADQESRILLLEKGHFQDLKAIDIQPAKLTKTLSPLEVTVVAVEA